MAWLLLAHTWTNSNAFPVLINSTGVVFVGVQSVDLDFRDCCFGDWRLDVSASMAWGSRAAGQRLGRLLWQDMDRMICTSMWLIPD